MQRMTTNNTPNAFRCYVCLARTEENVLARVEQEKFEHLVEKHGLIRCEGDDDQFDAEDNVVLCARCAEETPTPQGDGTFTMTYEVHVDDHVRIIAEESGMEGDDAYLAAHRAWAMVNNMFDLDGALPMPEKVERIGEIAYLVTW